ncbi:MAG: GNAT family N-acetyltransferase [Dehalococcoidia bacterium]
MNWNLRPAHPGDAAAIKELVDLAYRVEDEFVIGNRTDEEDIPGLIARHTFLLAESPARDLEGAVFVRCAPPRGYFGMLAVHPVAQGHGLGALLVRAAERHCRDRKCTEMDLSVIHLREELASWYSRLGYAECGTEPFAVPAKLRRPAHFILMTRSLVSQRSEETT